jgi:hypothetical protein
MFLCHSHLDKPFAKKLARDLSRYGVRVWIDESEIQLGDSLIEKIREGIDRTEFFGAIISHNSVKSEWVKKELDVAMNKEIEGRRVKVLPLLIDKCEIPGFLKGKLYADFTDIKGYDAALEMVLRKLGVNSPQMNKRKNLQFIRDAMLLRADKGFFSGLMLRRLLSSVFELPTYIDYEDMLKIYTFDKQTSLIIEELLTDVFRIIHQHNLRDAMSETAEDYVSFKDEFAVGTESSHVHSLLRSMDVPFLIQNARSNIVLLRRKLRSKEFKLSLDPDDFLDILVHLALQHKGYRLGVPIIPVDEHSYNPHIEWLLHDERTHLLALDSYHGSECEDYVSYWISENSLALVYHANLGSTRQDSLGNSVEGANRIITSVKQVLAQNKRFRSKQIVAYFLPRTLATDNREMEEMSNDFAEVGRKLREVDSSIRLVFVNNQAMLQELSNEDLKCFVRRLEELNEFGGELRARINRTNPAP